MKCSRCQQENPSRANFCLACGSPVDGPAPLPKSYADLKSEIDSLRHSLGEEVEQKAATAEILRVISNSPMDVQPVFEAIAESAVRLMGALGASVYEFDGTLIHLRTFRPTTWPHVEELQQRYPRPPSRDLAAGHVILERAVLHIADLQTDPATPLLTRQIAERMGLRSVLWIPMLREGKPIGVIGVVRAEAGLFPDKQVGLLKTFADQAVIAIENVRLFKEVQEKNRALSESLEQQTATSEILRVISSSPTDVQPVFDAIVASAVRLCGGLWGTLYRRYGDMVDCVASCNVPPEVRDLLRDGFPRPLRTGTSPHFHRALVEGTVATIPNVETDPDMSPRVLAFCRHYELRSVVMVPLRGQHEILGALVVGHGQVEAFSDSHMSLLQTFADQAVIAIENVRLFAELDARNQDLTTALDQQTATSEILKVISNSPTNVQPVFDAIVRAAVRLCHAVQSNVQLFDGQLMHYVAQHNIAPAAMEAVHQLYPMPPTRSQTASRAVLDKAVIHVPDVLDDPEYLRELAVKGGWRSVLSVPMIGTGRPIGALTVTRMEPGLFSETEIALLTTFADQAVIAIENVRLFTELQEKNQALTKAHAQVSESLGQQTATSDVLRIIARSPTHLQPVLDALVESAGRLCEAADTFLLLAEGDQLRVAALHPFVEGGAISNPIHRDWVAGRALLEGRTVHVEDLANAQSEFPLGWEIAVRLGHRTALATPLIRTGVPIGALFLRRKKIRPFSDKEIALLQTFADQAVIAIENVRLFRELEGANRELSVASQHKSEFLANMSHELRTPLNAIIGFSEVLGERMFGELNEKQEEYLNDIHASGQHLLSLINDILDLSKIEAGRMELELSDFDLPTTIDNALMLVRERAGRRGVELQRAVDGRLGQIQADERKLRQVLLNLLSNAIKFTPEGGRIDVQARPVDGSIEVSVTDTGVGIAPEDREAVFEEFRQVGTADKKVEGTGLGLALSRKFIELHGGRIWVKSQVGQGSTFTFTVPARPGE